MVNYALIDHGIVKNGTDSVELSHSHCFSYLYLIVGPMKVQMIRLAHSLPVGSPFNVDLVRFTLHQHYPKKYMLGISHLGLGPFATFEVTTAYPEVMSKLLKKNCSNTS